MHNQKKEGFTLIELLIVIAIIAILAAVVFVATNPAERFARARDAKRQTDVETVAASIVVYQVDNDGDYPATVEALTTGNSYQVGTASSGCDTGCTAESTQAACVDLSALVTGGYLGSVPMDPDGGSSSETDYYIIKNSNGTLTAGACDPEVASSIEVTR